MKSHVAWNRWCSQNSSPAGPPHKALKIFCHPSQRHSVGVFSSKRLVTTCQSVTSLVNPLQPPCTWLVALPRPPPPLHLPLRSTAVPENVRLTAKVTRSNAPTPRSLFRVAGSRTNNICRALILNPRERWRRFEPPRSPEPPVSLSTPRVHQQPPTYLAT